MARTPCSKSVPDLRRDGRRAERLGLSRRRGAGPRGTGRPRRGRRDLRWRSTYAAIAYGSQRRSSEQRVRIPWPVEAFHQCWTSPSTNCRAGGAQEVLARQVRPREEEREDVLELVAEAVRAARLVVARARPEPAGEVLVEEPAVHEEVEGVVGRRDLHGPRASRPRTLPRRGARLRQRRVRRRPRSAATSARASAEVLPLPEEEDDPPRLAGLEVGRHLRSRRRGRGRRRTRPDEPRAAQRRRRARASRSVRGTPRRSAVAERTRLARGGEGDAARDPRR